MRKILLIVLFFAAVNNLHSQDTVNAKFFPMHVGNYYVYKYTSPFFTQYHFGHILRDTVAFGNKYYYFSNSGFLQNLWIRYDSTNGNLLQFKPGLGCHGYLNDQIIDSLASSLDDDIIDCNTGTRTCSMRSETQISFNHSFLSLEMVTYQKNVGLVSHCNEDPPPCRGYSILQGAIINGVLWGDTTVTYLEQISSSIPEKINLLQNFPNPFNPTTLLKFEIPKNSNARVSIYDNNGRLVEIIVNQSLSPGTYEIQWNAGSYPSGVYFYRLETEEFSQTKKMLLVR